MPFVALFKFVHILPTPFLPVDNISKSLESLILILCINFFKIFS